MGNDPFLDIYVLRDPSELEEFGRQVESHFEPVGWRETNIVDRIIMQMWRLRRVPEIEAGIFSFQLAKIELENTRRERSLRQASVELERLQAVRQDKKGANTSPPVTIDMTAGNNVGPS